MKDPKEYRYCSVSNSDKYCTRLYYAIVKSTQGPSVTIENWVISKGCSSSFLSSFFVCLSVCVRVCVCLYISGTPLLLKGVRTRR